MSDILAIPVTCDRCKQRVDYPADIAEATRAVGGIVLCDACGEPNAEELAALADMEATLEEEDEHAQQIEADEYAHGEDQLRSNDENYGESDYEDRP